MRINNLISFTYILCAAAIIAIGRIYDERLELLGLNFSVFISGFFILLSCIMIISIRSIKLTSTRALFYMFLWKNLLRNMYLKTLIIRMN